MLYLQKSSEVFLYLLSMIIIYYNDFTLIYYVYTIIVQYPCHIQQYPRANVLIFAEHQAASGTLQCFLLSPPTSSVGGLRRSLVKTGSSVFCMIYSEINFLSQFSQKRLQ